MKLPFRQSVEDLNTSADELTDAITMLSAILLVYLCVSIMRDLDR